MADRGLKTRSTSPTLKMTRAGKEVSEVLSSLDNSRAARGSAT
jgi:hypothetical protein